MKKLLEEFYGKPWDEAYELFVTEIEKRLLRRVHGDTNERLKSALIDNMGDLKATVCLRVIRINRKLQQQGSGIEKFYGMLENRIKCVYYEEVKRLWRIVRSVELDDAETPEQPAPGVPIDRQLEEREEQEIKKRCQIKCLKELPERIQNIFLEYYSYRELPPKERTQARLRLALRVADISASEATPEEVLRAKNNLDSMRSRWRKDHLIPCEKNCLKGGGLRS